MLSVHQWRVGLNFCIEAIILALSYFIVILGPSVLNMVRKVQVTTELAEKGTRDQHTKEEGIER